MPRKKPKQNVENDDEDENGEQSLLVESERDYQNENETFATSEATSVVSNGDLLKFQIDRSSPKRSCSKCSLQFFFTVTFSIFVYISPILFLTLPKIIPPLFNDIPADYEPVSKSAADIGENYFPFSKLIFSFKGFQGQLLSIAFKLIILMFATIVYLSSGKFSVIFHSFTFFQLKSNDFS